MLQSVIAAVFFVIQNLSNKLFSRDFKKGLYPLCALNALALTMGTALLWLLFRPGMMPAGAMAWAALFGLLFDVTVSLIVLTISRGPLGMSNLSIDMSVVVSVLFAALVWREPITPLRGAALLILLAVLCALALPEGREDNAVRLGWLILALVTMLFNGSLSVVQKAAFMGFPALSSTDFTFWSVAFGAAICLVMTAILKLFARARFAPGEPVKKLPLYAAGVGFGTAMAYYFQNWALTTTESIVVFPVVVGLNVAGLMAAAILFFGERLGLRKAVAFVMGLVGIVLLSM